MAFGGRGRAGRIHSTVGCWGTTKPAPRTEEESEAAVRAVALVQAEHPEMSLWQAIVEAERRQGTK